MRAHIHRVQQPGKVVGSAATYVVFIHVDLYMGNRSSIADIALRVDIS